MTDELLVASNVFVDTQVFRQFQMDFNHPVLRKLARLGRERKLRVLVTDVVDGEVRRAITERMQEAATSLLSFQKLMGLAKNTLPSEHFGLLVRPDVQILIQAGIDAWSEFLSEANAEVVHAERVLGSRLLELYFGSAPPFSSKKKKHEFPDAISMLSIEAWASEREQRVYVVSGDADLEDWCDSRDDVIHVGSLAYLIDVYNNTEVVFAEYTGRIHRILEQERERITEAVKSRFSISANDLKFRAGSWISDSAVVVSAAVSSIELAEMSVVEVSISYAVIELVARMTYDAVVDGPEYSDLVWSAEEERPRREPATLHLSEAFPVTLEITYEPETETLLDIEKITISEAIEDPPF